MGPALAVIGAVASVGGTVYAVGQQKKAARASARQQALAAKRSRRQAIRETQLARSAALATSQSAAGLGGSGVSGGIGSLSSQLGSGIGYANQQSALSQQISRYSVNAQTGQAVAGLGLAGFQLSGGFNNFPNLGVKQG